MSKVAIQGNASGTGVFTLASPATNTDRTLTLPDEAGTVLTSAGALSVNASAPAASANIDASGNLLVGTTSSNPISAADDGIAISGNGYILASRASNNSAAFDRRTTDGDIVKFYKDGTTVGSIGSISGDLFIAEGNSGLRFDGENNQILPCSTSASTDGTCSLGASAARFDDIYATNGTIQTSDRNEKQDIEALTDAEQRVAVAAKGLMRKFRWKSAVAEKGDEARIHFGIIAQDLQDAFAAEGLDAGRYAMFISSTWTDEETGEERTRLGVRYPELLAFIIGAL